VSWLHASGAVLVAAVCWGEGAFTSAAARPSAAPAAVGAKPAVTKLAAGPPPTPRAAQIPAALRAHAPQLEMSGLAWSATLDRYLVVVDDSVDLTANARHAPFVLALARSGKVDEETVPVAGVDEIDDAESLTAGPNDTFYLLTSHAPNRQGKLTKPRRQLLLLKLEQRRLRVMGNVDLLHGKGDVSHQLETVGLGDAAVDLEAITYRDGALYIGMKAPLLLDDSAGIFRLENLDEVFAAGKVPKHTLSLWGQVKLAVPPAGAGAGVGAVGEGIADLSFGPDGALYLCANAPKGRLPDGGGGLWRIATPKGGRMEATLVRRFPGLKPEGVTVAPDSRALTLVFDRDRRDPLWMTWPLD
jgi:hypothetical protein